MSILITFLYVLTALVSIFLIGLVLIQRGRGGGLAGAFGGAGGSSAFGTKAGDIFTRITIIAAVVWFVLNMILVLLSNRGREQAGSELRPDAGTMRRSAPADKGSSPSPLGLPGPAGAGAFPGPAPAPGATAPAPAPKTDSSLPSALDTEPTKAEAPAAETKPEPTPAPAAETKAETPKAP